MVLVGATVVTLIYPKTSIVPPLNVPKSVVPSVISTAPEVLSLAILTVIDVPAGIILCNVIVKDEFVPLIAAELVEFAVFPAEDNAPVAFEGFTPFAAEVPFSITDPTGEVHGELPQFQFEPFVNPVCPEKLLVKTTSILSPTQAFVMGVFVAVNEILGVIPKTGLTIISTLSVPIQPLSSVTTNVYV
jgi:hypothetical protein